MGPSQTLSGLRALTQVHLQLGPVCGGHGLFQLISHVDEDGARQLRPRISTRGVGPSRYEREAAPSEVLAAVDTAAVAGDLGSRLLEIDNEHVAPLLAIQRRATSRGMP